jgi:hypothetical protein
MVPPWRFEKTITTEIRYMKAIIDTQNVSTHALESMEKALKKMPEFLTTGVSFGTLFDFRAAIETAADLLLDSVKFIGPDNGTYFQRVDILSGDADFPHLPFDSICLEYHCSHLAVEMPSGNRFIAPEDQVCVLAFYPQKSSWISRLIEDQYGPCNDGEYVVLPIKRVKTFQPALRIIHDCDGWWTTACPVLISPIKKNDDAIAVSSEHSGSSAYAYAILPADYAKDRTSELEATYGRSFTRKSLIEFEVLLQKPHLLTVLELCNLLECTNIGTETIPAPTKLNKKRARTGKPPFSEFKVLTVGKSKERVFLPGNIGGTHASPRLHQRRGHIRRLPSGKKTWVRHHMVGSSARGKVVKDYWVAPSSTAVEETDPATAVG